MLNYWAKRGPWRVNVSCEIAEGAGLALLTLEKAENAQPYNEYASTDALQGALKWLNTVLRVKQGGLCHLLGLKVFDGTKIHILKSLRLREWRRTAALNDADEIASTILTHREKR
jgi:hypothetical protein